MKWILFWIAFSSLALAQSPRDLLHAWINQNRLVVREIREGKDVEVRLWSLKRKDYGALAKECVTMYKNTYRVRVGVWCYVYDNARAWNSDLMPPGTPGRTLGTCWIYRASEAFAGNQAFEKNDPILLKVGQCPRS